MAHSCPECDEACYCLGDIDDVFLDGGEAQAVCIHCPVEACDEDEDEDDPEDDDY